MSTELHPTMGLALAGLFGQSADTSNLRISDSKKYLGSFGDDPDARGNAEDIERDLRERAHEYIADPYSLSDETGMLSSDHWDKFYEILATKDFAEAGRYMWAAAAENSYCRIAAAEGIGP